jgi:hypothetical protein
LNKNLEVSMYYISKFEFGNIIMRSRFGLFY